MILIAVKDLKAQIYLKPNFQPSLADAIRSWELVCTEGESMIRKFPNDFRLHHIADFDAATGELKALAEPLDLGSAADFDRSRAPSL